MTKQIWQSVTSRSQEFPFPGLVNFFGRYWNRKIWYQKILGTGLKKFGTEKVSEPVSETNGNQKVSESGSEKAKCKQTKVFQKCGKLRIKKERCQHKKREKGHTNNLNKLASLAATLAWNYDLLRLRLLRLTRVKSRATSVAKKGWLLVGYGFSGAKYPIHVYGEEQCFPLHRTLPTSLTVPSNIHVRLSLSPT